MHGLSEGLGGGGGFHSWFGTSYRRLVSRFTFTGNINPQEGTQKVILQSLLGYQPFYGVIDYKCLNIPCTDLCFPVLILFYLFVQIDSRDLRPILDVILE